MCLCLPICEMGTKASLLPATQPPLEILWHCSDSIDGFTQECGIAWCRLDHRAGRIPTALFFFSAGPKPPGGRFTSPRQCFEGWDSSWAALLLQLSSGFVCHDEKWPVIISYLCVWEAPKEISSCIKIAAVVVTAFSLMDLSVRCLLSIVSIRPREAALWRKRWEHHHKRLLSTEWCPRSWERVCLGYRGILLLRIDVHV